MKKIITTALTLLPAAALFAQQGMPFTLKGNLTNSGSQGKAFLIYRTGDQNITDSATVTNGNFEFKGTVANPVKATLLVSHKGEQLGDLRKLRNVDVLYPYLEAGNIQLNGADSVYHATVNGGTANNDNEQMKAVLKPFTDQLKSIEAEEMAVPKDRQTQQLRDEFEKRYTAVEAEQKKAQGAFIKAHPASWVSLDALKAYGGYYPEASDLEPLFSKFSPELKNSASGKYYSKMIAKLKLTAIGAKAPVFAQNDKDGKSISTESFKGKYLLIDFWASWCGPCRRENPNVVKAYNQFKNKNFTILGVSLDKPTGRESWLKAIENDGLVWTQVSDLKFWKNEAATLYGVSAIPQNFLLDPEGRIIAKNLEGAELVAKLNSIFNTKGAANTGKSTK